VVILGLAGGVSLGPENPIIAINSALAVAAFARFTSKVPARLVMLLATSATIGALFGTPVAAALVLTGTVAAVKGGGSLWDRLFLPVAAAAAGALTMHLLGGQSPINALAVNKNRRRSIDTQRFRFFCRCLDRRIILLCEAGIELSAIQLCQRGFLSSDSIESSVALLHVSILAAYFLPVGMDVIHEVPVSVRILGGDAVGVDCRVHGPWMNFGQRIIFVDEADLVLVAVKRLRKKGRMHARAVGALQIVEVNDGHFCVWISANRPTGDVDVKDGIFGEVEGLKASEFCIVGRDEEADFLF